MAADLSKLKALAKKWRKWIKTSERVNPPSALNTVFEIERTICRSCLKELKAVIAEMRKEQK